MRIADPIRSHIEILTAFLDRYYPQRRVSSGAADRDALDVQHSLDALAFDTHLQETEPRHDDSGPSAPDAPDAPDLAGSSQTPPPEEADA